jgi:hypothetical protein
MRRSTVILACLLAFGLACMTAALTRPGRAEFEAFVYADMQAKAIDASERATARSRAATYLAGCRYRSCILWAQVERNGTPVYTAAFGQFVEQAQPQQRTSSRPYRHQGRTVHLVDASTDPAPAAG